MLNDRVEERTADYGCILRLSDLRRVVTEVLWEIEFNFQLFCDLLKL